MGAKLKPKNTDNLLKGLNPISLEYFCRTAEIDREVLRRRGEEYSERIAEVMDRDPFFFVCASDLRYDIVNNYQLEDYIQKHGIEAKEKTKKAEICMEHFMKEIHGV